MTDKKIDTKVDEDGAEIAKAPAKAEKVLPEQTLKYGMNSKAVQDLQQRLRRNGYGVIPNGVYGIETVMAVREAQRKKKRPETGIVKDGEADKILDKP